MSYTDLFNEAIDDVTASLVAVTGLRVVNARNTYYEAGDLLDGAAIDKYSFVRDAYIQRRQYQINEGRDDEESPPPVYQNPYE